MSKKKYFVLSLIIIAVGVLGILISNINDDQNENTNSAMSSYSSEQEKEVVKGINEGAPSQDNTLTMRYSMQLDSMVDYSDINQMKGIAEDIVIAKVKKIDGGTNYSEGLGGIYTSINTIGEIEIIESLKGDLSLNQIVPFIRCGGTILYSEYEKGLNDKRKYLQEVAKQNGQKTMSDYKYIKEIEVGDVDIEEGKTYLMFICYDGFNQRYEIFGQQYGLREYNVNTKMVMNNETNELENIDILNLK